MRGASASRQRGLSLLGWLVVLLIGGLLALVAIRLIPVYLEYSSVRTAVQNVLADNNTNLLSERDIRDGVLRRFTVNNVTSIRADELVIRREGTRVVVGVDYEVREPLLANVDLLITFSDDFAKDIR
ncbi:DUF4845 domain-containing protein [Isoalcanivorax beigongshangi]|uniref:DUF4845 domain-containing protein n=1 Tax=Isoalcanivorax beigongshangi TaxID=3238810 RepID=A0ABV4AFF4_9GAMM